MLQAVEHQTVSDFDRNVYCLLGIPIDAVNMEQALLHVRDAALRRQQCFLSTPNLNFLIGCQRDATFRGSLINSNLNIVDGLPLAWMARRLGIPVLRRVTGSGLFEKLMAAPEQSGRKLSVYFFGGQDGVAQTACRNLNEGAYGLSCAGAQSPGFGSVEALSTPETIDRINASGADFLVVSLGARKGQAWIEHNMHRLNVPVVSHLGAVVNFVAKTVDRAPDAFQKYGLEWLWRIKEEPALWSRYWNDGIGMLNLLLTRVLPHVAYRKLRCASMFMRPDYAAVQLDKSPTECRIALFGAVPDVVPSQIREALKNAALMETDVLVDLNETHHLSPAAFGLLLILRKHQTAAGKSLRFTGLSRRMRRLFQWNGVEYLLTDAAATPACKPVAAISTRAALEATSL
ncbi:MAG: hypothetical protein B7Y41_15570 [Hydrogenophilales bacterium 28-61-23]|nr:MAG: hypothetical protein B7Y41_15570 [Hydrogenophilales bacterium 28-61-23]